MDVWLFVLGTFVGIVIAWVLILWAQSKDVARAYCEVNYPPPKKPEAKRQGLKMDLPWVIRLVDIQDD